MLVEYTLVYPPMSAIIERPRVPEQGDAVQLMGDADGAIYDGTIQAVAEPVFKGLEEPVAYLLYVDVPNGQPRIHELVEHLAASGDLALRLMSEGESS